MTPYAVVAKHRSTRADRTPTIPEWARRAVGGMTEWTV